MSKPVATIVKVICNHSWADDNDTSTYSFATVIGAQRWVKARLDRHDLDWFAIEGQHYYPCDDNNPDGQLYIGVFHTEFYDVLKGDAANFKPMEDDDNE